VASNLLSQGPYSDKLKLEQQFMLQNISLGQQYSLSQHSGNSASVIEIGEKLVERSPQDPRRLKALARMMAETGEHERAQPYWQKLLDIDVDDFEALYHRVRFENSRVTDIQDVIDKLALQTAPVIREHIRRIIEEPLVNVGEDPQARVVSICGVSFCGSTLLDRILGSLPDTRSIGESHWLIKSYLNKVSAPIDFSKESRKGIPQCSVCGKDCEFLTHEFRAELAADRSRWYFKIAQRLNTSILIAADKNVPKLVENDPLLRMDGLVLFKSPIQAWYSHFSKLAQDKSEEFYRESLEKYVATWTKTYSIYLNDFKPAGKVVFMNFDRFTENPDPVFEALLRELNLPHDLSVLKTANPGHAIGGNGRAMSLIRNASYGINITPLKPVEVPQYQADAIASATGMQNVYESMLEKCISKHVATH